MSEVYLSTCTGTNNIYAYAVCEGGKLSVYSTEPSGQVSQLAAGTIVRNVPFGLLAGNGWRYNSDGSLEQWGNATVANGATITFPRAFSEIWQVMLTVHGSPAICSYSGETLNNFVVNHNQAIAVTISWRAIGK